jgi:hypothetical protein
MTGYNPACRPDATQCTQRLTAIAHDGPLALPTTAMADIAAVADIASPSARASAPARSTRADRAPRPAKPHYGIGAVGAAGVALTVLMLTTSANSDSDPPPGQLVTPTQTKEPAQNRGQHSDNDAPPPPPRARTGATRPGASAPSTGDQSHQHNKARQEPRRTAGQDDKHSGGPHASNPGKATAPDADRSGRHSHPASAHPRAGETANTSHAPRGDRVTDAEMPTPIFDQLMNELAGELNTHPYPGVTDSFAQSRVTAPRDGGAHHAGSADS